MYDTYEYSFFLRGVLWTYWWVPYLQQYEFERPNQQVPGVPLLGGKSCRDRITAVQQYIILLYTKRDVNVLVLQRSTVLVLPIK